VGGITRRLDDGVPERRRGRAVGTRRKRLGDTPDALSEVAENLDCRNGGVPRKEPRG
jgi:hypothetical protein